MPIPGPAAKPADQRRRRNQPTFPTTKIPAAGRGDKPTPPWPAGVTRRAPGKGLVAIWEQLWAKPQAVIWERQHLADVVARYAVMRHRQMTSPDGELKKFASEVRMLEDRLGLNAASMLKLRWEIEDEVDDAPEGAGLATVTSLASRGRGVLAVDPMTTTADDADLEEDDEPELDDDV